MFIVTGHLRVDADQRDRHIALSADVVRQARSAPGCLDFHVSPDPVDLDRVNIGERWTDRASCEAFRGHGMDDEMGAAVHSFAVEEYEVADA